MIYQAVGAIGVPLCLQNYIPLCRTAFRHLQPATGNRQPATSTLSRSPKVKAVFPINPLENRLKHLLES
jgi:hypothetical protein